LPAVIPRSRMIAPNRSDALRDFCPNSPGDIAAGTLPTAVMRSLSAAVASARFICCVAWSGSRQIGRSISLGRYLQLGHITAQLGPIRGVAFDERALLQLGYKRRIEVTAPNFTAMAAMVIGTDRVNNASPPRGDLCAKLSAEAAAATGSLPGVSRSLTVAGIVPHDHALTWLREIIATLRPRWTGHRRRK
jgi:hypothetical protein